MGMIEYSIPMLKIIRVTFKNVPLEPQLPGFPQDREIVASCRGPYCVFADEAVALLHTNGTTHVGSNAAYRTLGLLLHDDAAADPGSGRSYSAWVRKRTDR